MVHSFEIPSIDFIEHEVVRRMTRFGIKHKNRNGIVEWLRNRFKLHWVQCWKFFVRVEKPTVNGSHTWSDFLIYTHIELLTCKVKFWSISLNQSHTLPSSQLLGCHSFIMATHLCQLIDSIYQYHLVCCDVMRCNAIEGESLLTGPVVQLESD